MSNADFALYIHIPYCQHKCPYCDFNTYALKSIPEQDYCQALLAEFSAQQQRGEWANRKISSIYFGGGTPSIFSSASIEKLVSAFMQQVDNLQEFTLEANPEGITLSKLKHFKDLGLNRISFGAQSLLAKNLRQLGRTHTADDVLSAVELSRKADIQNINLDLMFGIPEQSLDDLQEDIKKYDALNIEHISAYNLTIEPGTTFHQRQHAGSLVLPAEDNIIEMFNIVKSGLKQSGFMQYEISNYAKPGKESLHNIAYWTDQDYLGLGAGAHSYCKLTAPDSYGRRWSNLASPASYIQAAVNAGKVEAWQELLNLPSAMFEFLFLGLRLNSGVSIEAFEKRFGQKLFETYSVELEKLIAEQLLEVRSENLLFTDKGRLLSDSVFEILGPKG